MGKEVKKMLVFISFFWVFFLFSFFGGYYISLSNSTSSELFRSVYDYIAGHKEEKTTLLDKVTNDFNIKPSRFIVDYKPPEREYFSEISSLPLKERRDNPEIFLKENAKKGYRAIQGVFDFTEGLHGVILINPKGEIEKSWVTEQESVEWRTLKDHLVFPHGLDFASDGSFVVAYDNSNTLTKYNYCGDVKWKIEGFFNHAISFTENEKSIWTLGGIIEKVDDKEKIYNIIKIDYGSGEVIKKISIEDIIRENIELDIFGLNQNDTDKSSTYIRDPFHLNDVDPLSVEMAKKYSMFDEGDILLSFRSLNLVTAINPDNLKVKWWIQGLTRRQHDPDWNNNGTITIFDNRMHRDFSNIVEINPATGEYKKILDGEYYNFYSRIRGKHQLVDDENILIVSTQQGRVFEVNESGEIVFELINAYEVDKNENLLLSDAKYMPVGYFKDLPDCNN